MAKYARIVFESPLPQLDKLFDYRVPVDMPIQVGLRVKVPFGRAKKLQDGFVVELTDELEYSGQLSEISEIISPVPVLTSEIYELCRAVADRQAVSIGDVLRLAVPKKSVRVEQAFLANRPEQREHFSGSLQFASKPADFKGRLACLAEPRLVQTRYGGPSVQDDRATWLAGWIALFVSAGLDALSKGKSTLLVVPDFRDRARVFQAFEALGLTDWLVEYSADKTPSQRYASYLKAIAPSAKIVLGSRAAVYLDVPELAQICLWDDQDQSLEEPTSPYLHAREVLLMRQQQSKSNLLIASHSRSPEVQRLIALSYLQDATVPFAAPAIAVSESTWRLDSAAHRLITEALNEGQSVLVQVASPGSSVALYCADCSTQLRCPSCHGPLGLDAASKIRCRWCAFQTVQAKCAECTSNRYRQGRPGSTRTVSELGKVFPGVPIIEATFDKRVTQLVEGKRVVVATPGAEPVVSSGYGAVILLDGENLLSRDSLRASEHALNVWSNAVAMLGNRGRALLVGIAGQLGKSFALWNQVALAEQAVAERASLGLPPAKRLGSITGPHAIIQELASNLTNQYQESGVRLLGPSVLDEQTSRVLVEYEYRIGGQLADYLKVFALNKAAGAVRNSANGRLSRALKIRMDDYEVI